MAPESLELPKTHTALLQGEGGLPVINHDVPLPELGPGHILVKTAAVALNPCDFKTPAAFPNPGHYIGCDFAGTVVALGSDIARDGSWKIGDRVFGAIHGANPSDRDSGAHAEYAKAAAVWTFRIPDWMTFEEAVGLSPCCIATMGLALFKVLELPGTFENPAKEPVDVLIYGGSSCVGGLGIQMVKMLGHRCITTCSPKNFDLVRSYGADEVFDYRSPTCAQDIRSATRNCLKYAVDPFGEVKTMLICTQAIGRAGGRYASLEKFQEDVCDRKTVRRELVLGPTIVGKGFDLGGKYKRPPQPELGQWGVQWYRGVQRLIDEKKFKPHPIHLLKGGFDDVVRGLEMLQRREVSAEKLVVNLSPSSSGRGAL
ncbi:hypothetical protein VTI74DRAFT_3465 [Chaetomium olivicolor]